jgi:hypothetical protein
MVTKSGDKPILASLRSQFPIIDFGFFASGKRADRSPYSLSAFSTPSR